jgi:hypothetical protein
LNKKGKPVKYLIVWKSVDGEKPDKTWVPVAALRKGQFDPKEESKLEREFWAKQKGKKKK